MNETAGASPRADALDAVLMPVYALAVLVGTAGNSLVILVVKTKRSMKSTTNLLLANLALADLLTLVWCMPAVAMTFVPHPGGLAGDFLCKLVTMHLVPGITLIVSGLTLALISVERYKALLRPMEMHRLISPHNVKYALGLIWGVAAVLVAPLFVFERFSDENGGCVIAWPVPDAALFYWGTLALIVLTALLTMVLSYLSIIRGIFFSGAICSAGVHSVHAKEEARAKKKIVLMLLTVTLVFLVCFVPFILGSALMVSTSGDFYKLSTFLVYCNCALNPIVYASASSNYRDAFREVWRSMKYRC